MSHSTFIEHEGEKKPDNIGGGNVEVVFGAIYLVTSNRKYSYCLYLVLRGVLCGRPKRSHCDIRCRKTPSIPGCFSGASFSSCHLSFLWQQFHCYQNTCRQSALLSTKCGQWWKQECEGKDLQHTLSSPHFYTCVHLARTQVWLPHCGSWKVTLIGPPCPNTWEEL